MISAADLEAPEYVAAPDETKVTAVGLWLHMDALGRGPLDPEWIASKVYPLRPRAEAAEMVIEHILQLMETGFLTTYVAEGREWILLLRPLKADLRRTKISTPEPPADRPWTSVAMGRESARAGVSEWARERAREQVRAEETARADAWAAVQGEREVLPQPPTRPLLLDAPPIGCAEHPNGIQNVACGPCRTARLQRDEWLARRIYEEKLAQYHEQAAGHQQPRADEEPW